MPQDNQERAHFDPFAVAFALPLGQKSVVRQLPCASEATKEGKALCPKDGEAKRWPIASLRHCSRPELPTPGLPIALNKYLLFMAV